MEWLIQALSTIREVRDWVGEVGANLEPVISPMPIQASDELRITPIGPARPAPTRTKPVRTKRTRRRREAAPQIDLDAEGVTIPVRALDRDAVELVRRLQRFDQTAYLVGGCVRDLLVGLPPKDFDVSTSARPEQIKKIFRNSRIIGRRFRLAHVYFRGGKIIETSTFRASAAPEPEESEGSSDLLITRDNVWGNEEEDAQRRDFTINGLFYDVASQKVIDYVDGLEDIRAKRIRTIGDADIRLQEDPVRILRAARFAAKLQFDLDEPLREAMVAHRHDIGRCSQARVLEETFKLLRSGHAARSVRVLQETEVLEVILPEIARYLEHGGEAEAALLDRYLAALDEVVREQRGVSDAVVLAALLHPSLDEQVANAEPHLQNGVIADYLAQLTVRMGATKRVRERLRQIFAAQKSFHRTAGGRRARRRVSPASLMKRAYFADALDLFDIYARASGEGLEDVATWRQRSGHVEASDPEEGAAEPPASGRRRRQRSRSRKAATTREPNADLS